MLLPYDANLVQRDAKIPGLSILFDPEAFISLLQTRLPDVRLESGRIAYVRYKPGTNCLALYQLEAGGEVFEVYATAYGCKAVDKLEKARTRSSVSTTLGAGRLVFEDEAIVASFFPNDAKIRSLTKLADAETRGHLLRKLFPDRPNLWDGSLRGLRYKPQRRYVTSLLSGGETAAVLKFYAAAGYRAARAGARAFHQWGALRLARELGSSDKLRVIVFEWIDGEVLNVACLDENFKSESIEQVGARLAELHAQQPDGLPLFSRAEEFRTLWALARGIGDLCPHLSEQVQNLAGRLIAFLQSEPERTRPIHGDFYANQVILGDDSAATILDIDQAVYGDPAADLGNFIAHLEYEYLQEKLTAHRVESFGQALLDGYNNSPVFGQGEVERVEDRLVKLYTAIGLFRLAPRPFRDHSPNWEGTMEKILERAERMLALTEIDARTTGATHGKLLHSDSPHETSVSVSDPFGVTNDSKMPFLRSALNPAFVESLFAHHLRQYYGLDRTIRVRSTRVVRYKPGRRAMIEYDIEVNPPLSGRTTCTLVGKVRAKGLDEATFDLQRHLWLNGFGDASIDGISVPEPVAMVPELNMWLQRHVKGKTAFSLLGETGGAKTASRIVEAIYKLHGTALPEGVIARSPHTLIEELNILHERLAIVAVKKPCLRGRLRQLLSACDSLRRNHPGIQRLTIHRDFYHDQVIFSGSRTYLIDLDLLCLGDPALDVGNFLGHIVEQSLRTTGSHTAFRDIELALENRYEELAGDHIRPAVRDYTTLSLVRHIYLSTQFAERSHLTEKLLEICEERLGSAGAECNQTIPPGMSIPVRGVYE